MKILLVGFFLVMLPFLWMAIQVLHVFITDDLIDFYRDIKAGDWSIVFEKLMFFGAIVGVILVIIGITVMAFS